LIYGEGVGILNSDDFTVIVLAMNTPTMQAINVVRSLVPPEHLEAIQTTCRPWMAYDDIAAVARAEHNLIIELAV